MLNEIQEAIHIKKTTDATDHLLTELRQRA